MLKILFNNYLIIIALFLRLILAILIPKLFDPAMLANYSYILVIFFWFMVIDLGTSNGFSLRVIRRYNSESINFAYILSSFLSSFLLTGIIIFIYFLIPYKFLEINFSIFFLTYFSMFFYSFLTTIFRSLGLYKIDFKGQIIVSLCLISIISFNDNFPTHFYILFPYLFGSIYLLYAFRFKITTFFKKTKGLISIAIYNIKNGFNLYLTNSLLVIFPLMDKVVFSDIILIENYGNYLFSYSLSSLHVLVQSQLTNKYYRTLLSQNISENRKKVNFILISLFGHVMLFSIILFIVNLNLFKSFYSNYLYIDQYILQTEFICISLSILAPLYLIINSKKFAFSFIIVCYIVPVATFVFYKLNLIDNIYNWTFVYFFELSIATIFLLKKKMLSFPNKLVS
jgi:O-antigen/teichoic acid export membrane protein